MAKKEFLDVAKKVAKNLENAAVNADGASADAINAAQQMSQQPDYGMRNDGVTPKGNGYFGPLKTANGDVATEYTVGVGFDGKDMDIPTLVPTLTDEEVGTMINDIIPNKKNVPEAIVNKAVEHARKRLAAGRSVFADDNDTIREYKPAAPAAEPIINPNLVADAAQKVKPRPEGVNVGKFTIPNELVNKVNDTAAKVIEEQQKTPEQREEDQFVAAQEQERKSFADYLEEVQNDIKREEEEGKARERESKRNAAWAGATEMAAALANLFSVGAGAHSQQYKSVSQDWMRKADSEAKESRNRIQDLRQRQRETKLKMDQLLSKQALDLEQYRRQKEADRANIEYRKAMAEYNKARTEAERAEAEIKMKKAAAEIEALEALAKQRIMSGNASLIKANNPTQNGGSNKNNTKKTGEQLPPEAGQTPGYAWNGPAGKDWKFPTLKPGYGVVAEERENPDNTGLSSYK